MNNHDAMEDALSKIEVDNIVITVKIYMRFKWLALAGHTFQAN